MPAKKSAAKAKAPSIVLYGPPIYDAVRRGNLSEMKKIAAAARKHIKDVTAALAALEKKLGK